MSGLAANPPSSENKNVKRKKGKGGDVAADTAVPASDSVSINGHAGEAANGAEAESPYIRELHKSVRNLRKKLTNTEKASSILAENEGKSLDDLLAERKINADQKKQLENKPGVEAQLKITEEQLEHYKKFEDESAKRSAKKAEADQETLKKEHEKALQAKDQEADKIKDDLEKQFKERLLSLSRFLRTAAARRQAEEKLPENDAFEGVLLQLYGGDAAAVDAMVSFIDGSETAVNTVEGEPSGYTFKQIQELVIQQSEEMEAAELLANEAAPGSDPTIVNAGLTEIGQEAQSGIEATGVKVVPEAATIDADAANAAATALTSPHDLASSSNTENWVEVRNPDETDTGLNATPAAITNQESWAEDVPTDSAVVQPTNDGFSEVKHNRGGRGRGRGGRGRGDGYRGRGRGGGGGGFRGDGEHRGRGRGRGGYRGGPRGGGAAQAGDSAPVQS